MGKFFNGKVKNNRESLIKTIIIVVGLILVIVILLLIVSANRKKNQGIFELNDSVTMEINGKFPKTKEYFSVLKNYSEKDITVDTSKVDKTKIGKYIVTLTTKNNLTGEVKLEVVDTKAPELETKDLYIASGESYTADDFVESCEDNSKEECIIDFDNESQDEDGNIIDFANYTEDGSYKIKIIAYDENDNISKPQTVTLYIGQTKPLDPNKKSSDPEDPENPKTSNCKYGDLTPVDNINYPIAVIVGDETKGCALDRNLWDDKTVQKKVDDLYNADYKKLKNDLANDLNKNFPKGAQIVAYPHYISVLNKEIKGLVGYGIYVEVFIADANTKAQVDTKENLKLAYYLNSDGTRKYSTNVYNIK